MKVKVRRLQLSITESCDSRCVYCDFWRIKQPRFLSVEELRRLLTLIDMTGGDLVALTGGEPTQHPDVARFVDVVYETLGIKPLISTNCVNIERLQRILDACGHRVAFLSTSLDGVGAAHDRNRGVAGAYERVQEAQRYASSRGVPMRYALTVTPQNLDAISILLGMIPEQDLDIKCMDTSAFYYGDNSNKRLKQMKLERDVYRVLRDYYVQSGPPKNLYNFYNALYRRHGIRPACTAGRDELFVMANGDIYGCYQKAHLCNISELPPADRLVNAQREFCERHASCSDCFSRCAAGDLAFRRPYYDSIAAEIVERWRLGEESPENDYATAISAPPH